MSPETYVVTVNGKPVVVCTGVNKLGDALLEVALEEINNFASIQVFTARNYKDGI